MDDGQALMALVQQAETAGTFPRKRAEWPGAQHMKWAAGFAWFSERTSGQGRDWGRPPLSPFRRAAAAFTGDDFAPPRRPNSAIQVPGPNNPATSPGTLMLKLSAAQWRQSPLGRIST